MIKIAILGAGNVGTHLFKQFSKCNAVNVSQWYNRTFADIKSFTNETDVIDDLTQLKVADIYLLAVSDDAIAPLSQQLPFTNRLVVHTSGSVNIHDMDKKNTRGVFYPLQTFSSEATVDFKNVPLCIESESKENFTLLKSLGEALGSKVYKINTEQRQTLHLSAVFVNNFSNQLYRIAHEISDAKSINFEILKPLIQETASKIEDMSPYMAQTGPAKRNDKKTIKRHLKQLDNEDHKTIYQLMTDSIKKTHGIVESKRNKPNN